MGESASAVAFKVLGLPAPQGSKSAYVRGGRAVIVDGTSKTGRAKHLSWRDAVAEAADRAREGLQFGGPVSVHVEFYLPLPVSDPHRTLHYKKPDIDKLVRSVLDSLTSSGLIRDDALVHALHATKQYARDGHWTGASIAVVDGSEAERHSREILKAESRLNKKAR